MADIKSITGLVEKSQLKGIVSDLVTFVKGQDTAVTNSYKALVGNLGKVSAEEGAADHTVKSYVDAAITAANGDISTLEGKVDTLIGEDASKSVRTIAAEETAKVVASAPEAFDTLKEIADWIGSGDVQNTTAATMLADITKLKGADTVEGSVAYAVKQAKEEIIGSASDTAASTTITGLGLRAKAAEDRLDAIEGEGEGSIKKAVKTLEDGQVKTNKESIEAILATENQTKDSASIAGAKAYAKDYADGLAGNYDVNGAASAVQGETDKTVKNCEDAINGFALMTDADVAEIKALIA